VALEALVVPAASVAQLEIPVAASLVLVVSAGLLALLAMAVVSQSK